MTRVYCNRDCHFNKDGDCRTTAISIQADGCKAYSTVKIPLKLERDCNVNKGIDSKVTNKIK